MKTVFNLLIALCLNVSLFGQNTNISGIINTYLSVTGIQSDTITVTSTSGMMTNDLLLIIQMQGATINQSNTSSFGDITNYNHAGNYEYVRICQVINSTQIITTQIQRSYNISENVQVITVPEYVDATVTGVLTADPWNGQTGGVLVFDCSGTLTLSADVDLQGLGFRGGDVTTSNYSCSWLFNIDDYFYDITNGEGAKKGEGIAVYISGKSAGRGKQANGGGGGNDHNSGGGGGSNGGIAGDGGERIAANSFACSGPNTGGGGAALSYSLSKVFLGGGGGAGHENNANTATSGMNGGGIVIIKAGALVGNSNNINVSGQAHVLNSEDGAGGGGAGGTILLDVMNYTNTINLNLNGSNGGSVSNVGSSNCNGPGGGGSGGVFLYSNPAIPSNAIVSIAGGNAGVTLNTAQSSCTVGGTNDATNGSNGLILDGLTFFEPVNGTVTVQNSVTLCSTDSLFLQDAWQNTQGIYYDTIVGNCLDTVIETTLNLYPEIIDTLTTSICFGDSLVINNTTYSTSIIGANAVFLGGGQNGCDSVLIINLDVLPEVTGVDIQSSCDDLLWIDGNMYNQDNNSAVFTIQNGSSVGCDSTVMLDYTKLSVDASLTQLGYTLSANSGTGSYQWYNCSNGNYIIIQGETSQTFSPNQNGFYAVEVSENGCTDTSNCVEIFGLSITDFQSDNAIKIYPNPAQNFINIDLGNLNNATIRLKSIDGKLIMNKKIINSNFTKIDLEVTPGAYLIEVSQQNISKQFKFLVIP